MSSNITHVYIDDNKSKIEVEVYIDNNGVKQIKENGLKVNKYSDYIGKIPLVVFSPDNMNIVKGSPANRRTAETQIEQHTTHR